MDAAERDAGARQAWREEVAAWVPEEVVIVDETGSTAALTPRQARAPHHERAHDRVPFNKGKHVTTVAALTTAGSTTAMTLPGAADRLAIAAFVREYLVPQLRPGMQVVWENVKTHKGTVVEELITAAGCTLHFLPAYSPDRSPIEEACAKVKALLRRAKARTTEAVQHAIGPALDTITAADAHGFFRHCGYGVKLV